MCGSQALTSALEATTAQDLGDPGVGTALEGSEGLGGLGGSGGRFQGLGGVLERSGGVWAQSGEVG